MVILQTHRTLLVLFALICVTKSSLGFNTATTLPSVTTTSQSIVTPKASNFNIKRVTSSSKYFTKLQAHRGAFTNQVSNLSCKNNLRSSGLFHRRHHEEAQRSTCLMAKMSEDKNVSSGNENLLVRVLSQLRVLVAKLWVSSSHNHNLTSCAYYIIK